MAGIIDINSVRKGNKLDIDGEPYLVVGVDFRKPGKGTPSTVVKMKSMITGNVIERTYKSGEKLEPADVVSLLECWLELEGTPAHASIAGLLIQQVLPPIVRRWGRKDRAAAKKALRHNDAAQERLRTALGIRRKRWKILFWILPVMLGSLVIVGVLLVRSGYKLEPQWPPSLSKRAPPAGGSPRVAPAKGSVK